MSVALTLGENAVTGVSSSGLNGAAVSIASALVLLLLSSCSNAADARRPGSDAASDAATAGVATNIGGDGAGETSRASASTWSRTICRSAGIPTEEWRWGSLTVRATSNSFDSLVVAF
jgi:hypothetical protein